MSELRACCTVVSGAPEEDTFVGVRVVGGKAEVRFPLGYVLPPDEGLLRRDVLSLLAAIKLSNKNTHEDLSPFSVCTDDLRTRPISDYVLLVSDFLSGGRILTQRLDQYEVRNVGSFDWHRTMGRFLPVLGSDGSPIYLDYVVKRTLPSIDSIITKIHLFCLGRSFNVIGWLFTPARLDIPHDLTPKGDWPVYLQKQIENSFNDREQRLLRAMLSILRAAESSSSKSDLALGTYRFEYVWEKMVDIAFGSDSDLRVGSRGVWKIPGRNEFSCSPRRPDTLGVTDDACFVIDSKYYRFGITGEMSHLPGTTSIDKQIIYAVHLENLLAKRGFNKRIFNVFVLPGQPNPKVLRSPFKKVGEARSSWCSIEKELSLVHALTIDSVFLLRNYDRLSKHHKRQFFDLVTAS